MWQIYPTGMIAKVTPDQGPQSSRRDVPLGTMVTDGIRKFRWAHIALQEYLPGVGVVQSTTSKEITTGYFTSCARVDGTKTLGQAGDIEITLFSCLLLSANRYVDGTLTVVSGTGAGQAYGIASYQACVKAERQRVRLKTPLAAKLSTDTQAVLVANPYYGLKKPATSTVMATGVVRPMGALTGSDGAVGDSSGFQWIQVAGTGICHGSATVIVAGELLALTNSGHCTNAISATAVSAGVSIHVPVCRALQARAVAERYCACEWLIEK